ncbi:MAG: HAD family hydrolase [Thermoanaerobaculia bacterium]
MTRRKGTAGLIFDIDGTLVDSNDFHAEAWQLAFREFGKRVPFDVVRSQIGKGGDLLVPDLLQARDMRAFGEKLKKFRKKLWKDRYIDRVRPFPRATASLRALRELGIRLVLASSSDPDEVRHYVELLGIGDILEGSTSKRDAGYSKPYPEIFEVALAKIGTPASRTAAVGDTPYDILAAHRLAIPIVAVRSGGFPRSALAKAEFLMRDVPELTRRIERLDDYFAR